MEAKILTDGFIYQLNRAERYKKALEFYADKKNWESYRFEPEYYGPAYDDGATAREALKEYAETSD